MANLDQVHTALEYYNDTYRHPDLRRLSLSGRYSLSSDSVGSAEDDLHWPNDEWPNSGCPGVYLFFGPDMSLLRVGKASQQNLGYEIGPWFPKAADGTCAVRGTWKSAKPAFVISVAVEPDKAFEACAIEEYLIKRLQPPDNERGK